MDAIISGQAGLMILVRDGATEIFRRGDPKVWPLSSLAEIGRALDGCDDAQLLLDTNEDAAQKTLENLWRRDRSWRLALIAIDIDERTDLRVKAVRCLEDFLHDFDITVFLQNILFSAPLPPTADPDFLAKVPHIPLTQALLTLVRLHNENISLYRNAWNALPDSIFAGLDARQRLERTLIESGLFKDLIIATRDRRLDFRPFELAWTHLSAALSSPHLLRAWINNLRANGVSVEASHDDYAATASKDPAQLSDVSKQVGNLLMAKAFTNLAEVYFSRGEIDQAEHTYRQAIEVFQKALAATESHPRDEVRARTSGNEISALRDAIIKETTEIGTSFHYPGLGAHVLSGTPNVLMHLDRARLTVGEVTLLSKLAARTTSAEVTEKQSSEGQTGYSIILKSAGDRRVNVMKVIQAITGVSRATASRLVTRKGSAIKKDISQKEAYELKVELENVGAAVEIVGPAAK